MAKSLFGNRIEPSCVYCKMGEQTADPQKILCSKCGIVSPTDSCKRFVYDPLLRVPRPPRALQQFDPEDFHL